MPTDYKKEWMEKSAIDYFSPFISLWLACNSWYMSHYSDLNDSHSGTNGASDRDFINKLKEDTSGRNHFYRKFEELIDKVGKEGIAFRTDLERNGPQKLDSEISAASGHAAILAASW